MNSAELIRLVFDGEAGPIVVFDMETDQESEHDLDDLSGIPANAGLLMEKENLAFGVRVDNPDRAAFKLTDGDKTIYVCLLNTPVPLEDLSSEVMTDIPLTWKYVDMGGVFHEINDAFSTEPTDPETGEDGAEYVEFEELGPEDGSGDAETSPQDQPSVSTTPEEGSSELEEPASAGSEAGPVEAGAGQGDDVYGELNDAVIMGPEPEGFVDFLHQPATFLTGEMWGAKDRRNTQDGDWQAVTLPWGAWINGGEGDKNRAAWGLSRHPVGKNKEGASIVLGSSIEGARKANAMNEMFALGLDIDSGAPLDDVVDKIRRKGLLALIYTSHSHGKSGLDIKRDEVMRKLGISDEPTLPQVQEYLRMHSKSRYEESFIAQVRIEDAKRQTKEGVKIILSTPPLDKFRIIFPLAEAVKLIDLAPTQQAALEVWEDKITGMAWEALGVHFDTSCTDPSRLFYTARHAEDAEWDCLVLRGEPLKFEDVPVYKKHQYAKHRQKLSPWEIAGDDGDVKKVPECQTPSGKSLNDWHRHSKDRFQIATLLEDHCPDKIRRAGGEADGHVHLECPFESEHSSPGGTATMAVDALDSNSEYWTIFCHHDSCQGRHKLEFLEEMLAQGWFDEEPLFDESTMYFLDAGEEVEEPKEPPKDEEGEELTLEARAEAFNKQSKAADIEAFLKEMFEEGADVTDRARVNDILADRTVLGKRDLNKMWMSLDRVKRKMEADKARAGDIEDSGKMMIDSDFSKQIDYASRRLMDANQKDPFLFQYVQDKASVLENADGLPFISFVDQNKYTYYVNKHAMFHQRVGEDGKRHVSAPNDVTKHLFAVDNNVYPPLKGMTNTPVFAASGSLIRDKGYDTDSHLFYHPAADLELKEVSEIPDEEEVAEAKRLLIEELLGDFPIAAKTRRELVEEGLHGDGVPALTNLIAFFLLPFFRELLGKGSVAPGLLVTKPSPGSGASLLVDIYSIVTGGTSASPLAIPKNDEEMAKVLGAVLTEGRSQVYFDNINNNVDSGELASAMTADRYAARVLGKSQTVDVPVRSTFIFTGNNVMMSGELVRRLVLVDLDARLANPELRTGWRHTDIKTWASKNRGLLVWACLTLIANWVAQGRPEQHKAVLASYEDFCRKIGGVLEAAGLGGFLGNRDELKEKAMDDEGDEFEGLVEAWWDDRGTRLIYAKGADKDQGLCELAMAEELSLPIRKERDGIDGSMVYSSRGMGKLLSQHKDRIYILEDGSEVTVRRDSKKTKRGHPYFLELNQKAPQSNV